MATFKMLRCTVYKNSAVSNFQTRVQSMRNQLAVIATHTKAYSTVPCRTSINTPREEAGLKRIGCALLEVADNCWNNAIKLYPQYTTCTKMRLNVNDSGTEVIVTYSDGKTYEFPSIWLRFNCHCHACRQADTGHRLINPADIKLDTCIEQVSIENGMCVEIRWNDHKGFVPLDFLRNNALAKDKSRRYTWKASESKNLAKIEYKEILSGDEGVLRWLQLINKHGFCLVIGVPTENEIVMKVAEQIAPVQRTLYDFFSDINFDPTQDHIANTTASIDFHQDLLHQEAVPGLVFLHALRYDACVEGGESIIVDVLGIAETFREEYPEEFKVLTKTPIAIWKAHYDRKVPVDHKCKRRHIEINERNEIVSVSWSSPFECPLFVEKEEVIPYYSAYLKFANAIRNSSTFVQHRLHEGEIIVFNNRRMLHGRNSFIANDGVRHLQSCYIPMDDYVSRLKTLTNALGDPTPILPVGNDICTFTYGY